MIDYNNIAKKYAESKGYDSVRPSVDYAVRSRYLKHPHIIKISLIGKIERVLNFDEIYWVVKQTKEPLKM